MTNQEQCLKLHPELTVTHVIVSKTEGVKRLRATWKNGDEPCEAQLDMHPSVTPEREAWFTDKLYLTCFKMMLEDASKAKA